MKKLSDSTHKSGDTVYALRERLDRSLKETEDVRQRLKQASGECSELRRDVSSLQAEVDDLTEFVSLLKRFEPQKYAEVRQAQEHIHNQREQKYSSPPPEKRNRGDWNNRRNYYDHQKQRQGSGERQEQARMGA